MCRQELALCGAPPALTGLSCGWPARARGPARHGRGPGRQTRTMAGLFFARGPGVAGGRRAAARFPRPTGCGRCGALMEQFLFGFFALGAVAGSASVGISRNPIRSALGLVMALFCVAALFVLLDAHMLAALEVLVYAGAVMVLFLFVIMLLNLREEELGPRRFTLIKGLGVAAVAYMGWLLAMPMWKSVGGPAGTTPADFGTVTGLGRKIFTNYLLPFELTSVLLLAAVVGAVMLAKRKV